MIHNHPAERQPSLDRNTAGPRTRYSKSSPDCVASEIGGAQSENDGSRPLASAPTESF